MSSLGLPTRFGGTLRTILGRHHATRRSGVLAQLGSFGDDFFGDDVTDD